MNSRYYTIQDFLQDDSFVTWVVGQSSNIYWNNFSDSYPEQAEVFYQAKNLILRIRESQDLEITDINQGKLWDRIQETVDFQMETTPVIESAHKANWLNRKMVLFGFGLLAVLVGGYFLTHIPKKKYLTYSDLVVNTKDSDVRVEKFNTGTQPLLITLEDKSTILLQPNAMVNYPLHFRTSTREVILKGEAFFQVAKDPSRPFYVYSNGCTTKVLGTSFNVKVDDIKKQVIVDVRSGRVSVFKGTAVPDMDPEKTGLVLLPNQQVIYDENAESLTRKLVEVPHRVPDAAVQKNIHFDERSVTEILKTIEQLYGINILFSEDQLSNCFITTTLTDEPLYDQLTVICKTIGANYKEVDAHILIEAPGCS
jgi:transmembrane sensor